MWKDNVVEPRKYARAKESCVNLLVGIAFFVVFASFLAVIHFLSGILIPLVIVGVLLFLLERLGHAFRSA
jgi:fatty acid desaturase